MLIMALLMAATGAPCTFATLPAAEQKRYQSRYRRRVEADGKAYAEAWLQGMACPSAAQIQKRKAIKARGPVDRNGKPCARTRMEMRPVTSMDGSMTMIPRAVCAK